MPTYLFSWLVLGGWVFFGGVASRPCARFSHTHGKILGILQKSECNKTLFKTIHFTLKYATINYV